MEKDDKFFEGLIDQFIGQTEEDVDLMIQHALEIKDSSYSEDIIDELFRMLHSLKGHASLMGFFNLKRLAHATEDVISDIRMYKKTMSEEKVNLLLPVFDLIRDSVGSIRDSSCERDGLESRYKDVMRSLEEEKLYD